MYTIKLKQVRLGFVLGFLLGALVFGGTLAVAAGITAYTKTAKVVIDGKAVDLDGYLIEGSHYFKLRDLAERLKPGGKDFGIAWDGQNNRIIIDTSKPYEPENVASATPQRVEPGLDIPGGTPTDYSLQANPDIFGNYYTRAKYNKDRQFVLDNGEITTGWGHYAPSSIPAVNAADLFFADLVGKSKTEKVQFISKYLCAHLEYKSGVDFSGDDFWTGMAYGVCTQYAQMFRYMCYRSGIPCIFVTGVTDGNRHAWNEVYIDEAWLFYDGNLSDIRNDAALGDDAKKRHSYAEDNQQTVSYNKELYMPGSTG